jgi:hypothetical protein
MISISRGNDELLRKLIRLFLRNTPCILKNLEYTYKAQDFLSFRSLINEIRPSFGYFSIRDVEADLELAERLAYINFSGRELGELMKRIMSNAEGVMREMEQELTQPGILFENISESSSHPAVYQA